jgi:hypothetical protein
MAASTIFQEIIRRGLSSGQVPAKTQQARKWYRETAEKIKNINTGKFFKDASKRVQIPIVGSMYMFFYDPKGRDELPYYDIFPLIFPFKKTKDGFYGINLHYLAPQLRARLMDGLYEYANNTKYDESTKIKMNYLLLQKVYKLRYFRPCVKRYLMAHVRSPFMYVSPQEWDIALFLPTEKFVKQSRQNVWENSRRMLTGQKPLNTKGRKI